MKLWAKLGTSQFIILALGLITAVIHLFLPGAIFKLNALGYLGLLALYFIQFSFLPIKREWVRWGFMAFAALTIIAYFVTWLPQGSAFESPVGIFTKIVEAVLIFFLWREK